ncbi:hypothetical protein DWZ83_10315 [Amedibacillus dolichus]|uniref:Type I restriction modification DNA specificity domain-containing protein n=1 Tax=Amedibacillus dolichus TaxID=31971 RepID=A0A415NZC6_9FIRM|nr:restriction endonuclease subunit S [Amedibacillus dolichus]RHM05726.1 hypothetical protein DWZ83_10315 [Amedibacillus dolichus]
MEDRMTAQQLKNSILQMAVQGKLVPQDLNDEPASVLLRRIKKEKEELIKEGKIKKSKTESFIFRGADNLHYEQIGKEVRCIEDELPFEIPDNWEWKSWGEVSYKIQYGYNAPAKDTGVIKMVRITDIQDNQVLWDSVPFCNIKENEIPDYLLHNFDILFARTGGTVGKSFLVENINEDSVFAGYLIRTVYNYNEINPKYLKYFMETSLYWSQLKKGTIATAQPNCNGQTLSKMILPIPPLQEQHRIVAKLQELEPLIEKYRIAEEQLHELNSNIKDQLKKSILQYAIEGKLVPQDPNDEPASVLLERIREEKQQLIKEGKIKKDKNESIIFRRDNSYYEKINGIEYCIDNEIPFEIPNSWQWARLNNIGNWGAGATPSKSNNEYYSNGTIPWLLTGDLNDGYITNIPNHITELALEKTSVKLNPSGSVLIAMYGATIGKLGILTFPATTNQACCACLVYKPFYSKYLFFYLLANKRNFVKKGEGGAQPNISKEKIIKTLIAVPPLKEQIRIVNLLGKVI